MKKNILFSIIISTLVVFSACDKESGIFAPTEKKIEGSWVFEKVSFQKRFTLSFDDITDDYKDASIEFLDDGVVYTNLVNNTNIQGSWNISGYYMHYGESGQYIEKLAFSIIDNSNGEVIDFEWDYLSVTNDKIRCSKEADGGYYRYTLVKL